MKMGMTIIPKNKVLKIEEQWVNNFILRKDSNDMKMKMGRKITLVLYHEPCRKNEDELIWMNEWHMCEDPQRSQVCQIRKNDNKLI